MSGFTNSLTPQQTERVGILVEELGEALHVCGKILRHGLYSYDPTATGTGKHNGELLEKELGDVLYAVAMLSRNGDLNEEAIRQHEEQRSIKIMKWLHYPESLV